MASSVNLEPVEAMAAQLPPTQRLKLAARICEELSATPSSVRLDEGSERNDRQSVESEADSLLAEFDAIADEIEGQFDSAEDIRQVRLERASRS